MKQKNFRLKAAAFVILFLLSFVIGHAAVSVETFTCNGMSGTVVVENGVAFSCQASLKNEDTQNSANIGSVSLLVSGSWAEKTSYTGSGFAANLGAGASTTAVFSGIKAVSPGATNKFQSVQIDNSADTFVTNTNVNVITIKSLTATASASSAAQGSEFDVEATVIAGGDLGSATLSWSGSGGCSLSSGHSASKDLGSLAHNTEATRSWRIVQGAADCVSTVTASGTSSSITTSKSKSVTVSFTGSSGSGSSGSSSSGSGGGGGGGGGGAGNATNATGATETPEQPKVPEQQEQQNPPEKPTEKREEPLNIGGIEIPKPVAEYGPYILVIVILAVAALGWLHYHKYPHKKGFQYSYKPK